MAKYRVTDLDLSTRIEIVAELLLPTRKRAWGAITRLAERYGISRSRLYQLKKKSKLLLQEMLAPKKPGPKEKEEQLVVDEGMIKRAIAVLPLLKGSTRDIQIGLEMLFGVHKSIGYINQTLQEAGERAAEYNAQMVTKQPMLGEADEIFQGRRPCLTVVDGRSFLLLNLTPADARDETNWGVTFLDLEAQGFQFQDMVADGARGLAAGLAATGWTIPFKPDLFHLLREAHPISQRLEREAYKAIETADNSRLVAAEAKQPRRRPGRPRQATLSVTEAESEASKAVDTLDLWHWLMREVRLALAPITSEGHICSAETARDHLLVAIELMHYLKREDISKFADKLHKHLDDLILPLAQLEAQLSPARAQLSPEDERLTTWVWRHRQELDIHWLDFLPTACQPFALALEHALTLFHRASSLAESIHAWIRPYLQIHRGMPPWLAPLLQLFWNHHRFHRGKRAGHTPAELAGITDVPSLSHLFASLFDQATVTC